MRFGPWPTSSECSQPPRQPAQREQGGGHRNDRPSYHAHGGGQEGEKGTRREKGRRKREGTEKGEGGEEKGEKGEGKEEEEGGEKIAMTAPVIMEQKAGGMQCL